MKPFRILDSKEQLEQYKRFLRRACTQSRNDIHAKYWKELESANLCDKRAKGVADDISAAEDHIANEADRKYGGWSVWRSNKKLLAAVAQDMIKRTMKLKAKRDAHLAEAAALRKPLLDEIAALEERTNELIREAELMINPPKPYRRFLFS